MNTAKPAQAVATSDSSTPKVRIGDATKPWAPKVRVGDATKPWTTKVRIGDATKPWH